MDVICTRCHTRYDFDEALVSSRGTTVKCTTCGHLFRVHRPAGSEQFEAWRVRTQAGRELVFDAMRDLQAAIGSLEVGPDDWLIAGRGEPRRLGGLAELETFFAAADDRRRTLEQTTQTTPGLGVDAYRGAPDPLAAVARGLHGHALPSPEPVPRRGNGSMAAAGHLTPPLPALGGPQRPGTTGAPLSDATPARLAQSPPAPERRRSRALSDADMRADTLAGTDPPTLPKGAGSSPRASFDEAEEAGRRAHRASRDGARGSQPSNRGSRSSEREALDDDDSFGDEAATRRGPRGADSPHVRFVDRSAPLSDPATPTPSAARPSVLRRSELNSDPRFSNFAPPMRRSGFARWIVALLALGLLGVGGFALLRTYLPAAQSPSASAGEATDKRLPPLLELAQERLDAGDVDGAKAVLDKAKGVAEKNVLVLQGLARVEIVRADLLWLKRMMWNGDAAEAAEVDQDLKRAIHRVEDAVEAAVRAAPDDPIGTRLQIHEQRLKGNRDGARRLVREFREPGNEDALVLAALDLSEPDPSWPSVIDRLVLASRAEKKLGRAHAMLVYALAKSGQKDRAERELAELAGRTPPHPLYEALRRLVEGATQMADATDAGSASSAVDDGGAAGETPTSVRDALSKARAAYQSGELARAESLYNQVLAESPGNTEALGGLADIARDRGDTGAAQRQYEQMLRDNPSYVPGLVSLADIKWQQGDRGAAVSLYRQVVDKAPGTSYAQHAQARLAEASRSPAPSATASSSPPPPPPPPTGHELEIPVGPGDSPPPTDLPPGVDTSDLP